MIILVSLYLLFDTVKKHMFYVLFDSGAKWTQCICSGDDVLAFEEAADLGFTNCECAEHEGAVGYGFIAWNFCNAV